jgi:hypothetical protein
MKSLAKTLGETLSRIGKDRSAEAGPLASLPSPADAGVTSSPAKAKASLRVTMVLGRLVVFISGCLAVYLAVGSWMFPGWFFGFIWRGKIASLDYWGSGVSYWLDGHPTTLAWAIVAGFVLLVAAFACRRMFLPLVDRFKFGLTSFFVFVLVFTAVLDYRYGRSEYELMELFQQFTTNLQVAVGQLFTIGNPPAIQPPISFQFLNGARVDNLYNQIEPELVEKQRTVVKGESTEGKGSLSAGPASAELGIGKKGEATSSFERSTFSSARKCEELMKFVLEQNRAYYYTDPAAWMLRATNAERKAAFDSAVREARTEEDIEKLKVSPINPLTPVNTGVSELSTKLHEMQLKAELSNLSGLVFVDGTFDVHQSGQGRLTLFEVFSEKPEHETFKIIGLKAVDLPSLRGKSKARLRIFGDVRQPLDDKGVVEIEAIAVY